MITRSTRSLTDRSVPPLPGTSAATTALPPVPPTAPAYGPDAGPPSGAGPAYPDPVDGLLHAAAANRPLEDVARLVTLLEQGEGGEDAAAGVLRVVGTDRPLEDVPLLVTVLSRPPHHAELVERLARERAGLVAPPSSVPQGEGPPPAPSPADGELRPVQPLQAQAQAPQAPPDRSAAVVPWTAWATAVALALCAAAYIPVHHHGVPVAVLAAALASAGSCLLPALLPVRGPTPALLMVAVLVPTVLVGAQLLPPRVEMTETAGITEAILAPAWLAAPTAAAAALTALLALLVSLLGGRRTRVGPGTQDRRPPSGG